MIVTVTGLSCTGKTTLSYKLAKEYGLEYVSGAKALMALKTGDSGEVVTDWWEKDGLNFIRERLTDFSADKKVDIMLTTKYGNGKNILFDSWVMPWFFDRGYKEWLKIEKPIQYKNLKDIFDTAEIDADMDRGFKIMLKASMMTRAERAAKRDNMPEKEAFYKISERTVNEQKIYEELYGFVIGNEITPFDLIVNTDELDEDQVFEVCKAAIDIYFKKRQTTLLPE